MAGPDESEVSTENTRIAAQDKLLSVQLYGKLLK
jgi:hypothetical protein